MSYGNDFILTLLTNDIRLAREADAAGVNRIGIDIERIGKDARQGHLPTWISDHQEADLHPIRPLLRNARLFARCNSIHAESAEEINRLLDLGVEVIMLPFFKTVADAEHFIRLVDNRAHPVLLVETAEAAAAVADLCRIPGVSELHIGLNDMRLSLGWPSHFHVLSSDFLASLCEQILNAGHRLGVGGIGRAGDNDLPIPADLVSTQIVRLGATASLVSRAFFRDPTPTNLNLEFAKFRSWLDNCAAMPPGWYQARRHDLNALIEQRFGQWP